MFNLYNKKNSKFNLNMVFTRSSKHRAASSTFYGNEDVN